MGGSLNEILPDPISPEDEAILLDLIRSKIYKSLALAVQLLHAMEERFGPEARQVVRDMAENQHFAPREPQESAQEALHALCRDVDRLTVGSHRWEKHEEDERIQYTFTRCTYAEVFRELGEPELGWVMCATDRPSVEAYHPGLTFERSQTLMEGHDKCDHCYLLRGKS